MRERELGMRDGDRLVAQWRERVVFLVRAEALSGIEYIPDSMYWREWTGANRN